MGNPNAGSAESANKKKHNKDDKKDKKHAVKDADPKPPIASKDERGKAEALRPGNLPAASKAKGAAEGQALPSAAARQVMPEVMADRSQAGGAAEEENPNAGSAESAK